MNTCRRAAVAVASKYATGKLFAFFGQQGDNAVVRHAFDAVSQANRRRAIGEVSCENSVLFASMTK